MWVGRERERGRESEGEREECCHIEIKRSNAHYKHCMCNGRLLIKLMIL